MYEGELRPTTPEHDPTNARVIELIVDLGNTVLTKRAISDLMQ